MTPEELKSLGVSVASSEAGNMFARILMLGPAKLGKTTALASTAPKPLHINCDGASALKETLRQGVQPLTIEAYNRKQLAAALKAAKALVAAGEVRTVILDSITLLAERIIREMEVTLSGFDLFREYGKLLGATVESLLRLDAHVFIVGHLGAKEDFEPGVLPGVPGQGKVKIPAAVDDWVIFDFEQGRKPSERMFLLGPQKGWNAGGRNIKRTTAVPATVPALFAEMGLAL